MVLMLLSLPTRATEGGRTAPFCLPAYTRAIYHLEWPFLCAKCITISLSSVACHKQQVTEISLSQMNINTGSEDLENFMRDLTTNINSGTSEKTRAKPWKSLERSSFTKAWETAHPFWLGSATLQTQAFCDAQ